MTASSIRRIRIVPIADYDSYMAFNLFRLAAIFHGIGGRVLRGTATSANARERAAAFPRLARLGREAMRLAQRG